MLGKRIVGGIGNLQQLCAELGRRNSASAFSRSVSLAI
jgi:hypothetical protein